MLCNIFKKKKNLELRSGRYFQGDTVRRDGKWRRVRGQTHHIIFSDTHGSTHILLPLSRPILGVFLFKKRNPVSKIAEFIFLLKKKKICGDRAFFPLAFLNIKIKFFNLFKKEEKKRNWKIVYFVKNNESFKRAWTPYICFFSPLFFFSVRM